MLKIKDHRATSALGDRALIVRFEVKKNRNLPCGTCSRRARRHDRLPGRTLKLIPIRDLPVSFVYRPCRVLCLSCGIRRKHPPWVLGKAILPRVLVVAMATGVKLRPIGTFLALSGISRNTPHSETTQAIRSLLDRRQIDSVLHIGIDRSLRSMGQTYPTLIYDLCARTVFCIDKALQGMIPNSTHEWIFEEMVREFRVSHDCEGVACFLIQMVLVDRTQQIHDKRLTLYIA